MRTATIEIGFDNDDFSYEEALVAFKTVRERGSSRVSEFIGEPKLFLNGSEWICKQQVKLTLATTLKMFLKKLFS